MAEAKLSAADCNFLDAQRIFMGFSETGEYIERRGLAIASCGLPAQALNFGFLKPPYHHLEATAAAVRSYFAARKLPFQLTFPDTPGAPGIAALESGGWRRRSDPTPVMTLAMPASLPSPPAHLAIEEVRTQEGLVPFREAAFRGFGYPVAAARLFLDDRLLALPQVRLFAGRVDGSVVATSILVATGRIAGVYWVATVEERRRRGYGEALTWAAVAGGRELGCGVASLQASKAGRPVYARMGFEHVSDHQHLLPPPAVQQGGAP